MAAQTHRINRQLIEVGLPSTADTHQWQNVLSRLYQQQVIPLLDEHCNALCSPDEVHRIERLEIDVGTLESINFEEQFMSSLKRILPTALREQLSAESTQKASHGSSSVKVNSQRELLQMFLQQGTVPWWADSANPELLEHAVEKLSVSAQQQLAQVGTAAMLLPIARRRLLRTLSDKALSKIAQTLWSTNAALQASQLQAFANRVITEYVSRGWGRSQSRRLVWEQILDAVSNTNRKSGNPLNNALLAMSAVLELPVADFITELLTSLPPSDPLVLLLQQEKSTLMKLAPLDEEAKDIPSQPSIEGHTLVEKLHATHYANATTPSGDNNANLPQRAQHNYNQMPDPRTERGFENEQPPEQNELYIGNGGLVILWPFLTPFFKQMKLVDENQFVSTEAQHRAIGLLQLVASGHALVAEYNLVLNKVLCGIALETVFEPDAAEFSAEDKDGVDRFMRSVISQAPVLKDMSVDGLRGTFLLRNGVLRWRDGAWLLQVERETYDIVLEQFPWQWQWVRLPSMNAPLRVEW